MEAGRWGLGGGVIGSVADWHLTADAPTAAGIDLVNFATQLPRLRQTLDEPHRR